jgi:hypothetical protein
MFAFEVEGKTTDRPDLLRTLLAEKGTAMRPRPLECS